VRVRWYDFTAEVHKKDGDFINDRFDNVETMIIYTVLHVICLRESSISKCRGDGALFIRDKNQKI